MLFRLLRGASSPFTEEIVSKKARGQHEKSYGFFPKTQAFFLSFRPTCKILRFLSRCYPRQGLPVSVRAAALHGKLLRCAGNCCPVRELLSCAGNCCPVRELLSCAGNCCPAWETAVLRGKLLSCAGNCRPVREMLRCTGSCRPPGKPAPAAKGGADELFPCFRQTGKTQL